jgi:exonuclease SbcC
MIPTHLYISGFLSYYDPADLDFTSFELACISGANGAGKSSLLDAITWALFGQARRRDDAIINSRAKAAEVILDFEYESSKYRIQRTKPRDKATVLEFFIHQPDETWKPLTEHSLRETEARIVQTLRMDYETFTNASFFLQGRADQFAQQRPGDRKRILSSILGLEVWESYRDQAAQQRKQLENDLTGVDGMLAEINEELAQEKERKARLKQLEEELERLAKLRQTQEVSLENMRRLAALLAEQKRMAGVLLNQYRAARQRLDDRAAMLAARQEERAQFQQEITAAQEVEGAYRRWQADRETLERWEQVAANFRQYDVQRAAPLMTIEAERSRLETELRNLMEQQRQVADLEKAVPGYAVQHDAGLLTVSDLRARLEQAPVLQAELIVCQQDQAEARADNLRLREEMKELKERIDRLKEATGASCPVCGQPLEPYDREKMIGDLEALGRAKGDQFRANQAVLQQCEQRRTEVENELKSLQKTEGELRGQQRVVDQLNDRLNQMAAVFDDWKAGGAKKLEETRQALDSENYALAARADLEKIDTALKELGYDAAAHDAARAAEQTGRASEEKLRQLETARAALGPLEREIAGLEKQLAADEADAAAQEEAYRQAEERCAADEATLPDLNQAEAELFAVQEQENRLRMQVGGAVQAVEVLKSLRKRHAEYGSRRQELASKIAQLKMLERAFSKDGVPALLIEQALPDIEAQANQILDRLTDGGMSVKFATQKDFKDKNREDKKETLDILISDAAGTREYELFSGGEAFRVNFAIRLAMSRVLAQRAGARLQTLVIDEGFGSQDSEGRQRLVEAINLVQRDFARILVITHLEELKDAFPARIEVEKTPHGSQVKVIA